MCVCRYIADFTVVSCYIRTHIKWRIVNRFFFILYAPIGSLLLLPLSFFLIHYCCCCCWNGNKTVGWCNRLVRINGGIRGIYWRLQQLTTTNNARIVIVITIGIVDNRIKGRTKKIRSKIYFVLSESEKKRLMDACVRASVHCIAHTADWNKRIYFVICVCIKHFTTPSECQNRIQPEPDCRFSFWSHTSFLFFYSIPFFCVPVCICFLQTKLHCRESEKNVI